MSEKPSAKPENIFKRIVFTDPDFMEELGGLGESLSDSERAKYRESASAHLVGVKEIIAKIADAAEGYDPFVVLDALENLMKVGVRATINPTAEKVLSEHLSEFHQEAVVLSLLGGAAQGILKNYEQEEPAEPADLDRLLAEMDKTVPKRENCICAQGVTKCPRHGEQPAVRATCPECKKAVLAYCAQGQYCTNDDCKYVA
jgi:hypothetical protein